MCSQLGFVNQLAPDHWHRDLLKIVRLLLLVQTRPNSPIQLRLVNISILVANRRDVHVLVVHEHFVLDEGNHVRAQLNKRDFHRGVEKRVGPFTEEASFEAGHAVLLKLTQREDLEQQHKHRLQVSALELSGLHDLPADLED